MIVQLTGRRLAIIHNRSKACQWVVDGGVIEVIAMEHVLGSLQPHMNEPCTPVKFSAGKVL